MIWRKKEKMPSLYSAHIIIIRRACAQAENNVPNTTLFSHLYIPINIKLINGWQSSISNVPDTHIKAGLRVTDMSASSYPINPVYFY